jgi:hypothetical protein
MKKCPPCYAIMRESITRTKVPALQQKPTDGTPAGQNRLGESEVGGQERAGPVGRVWTCPV